MTGEPHTGGLQLLSDATAQWTRGLAVVIAVLYGAGFVVVSTYLGSYGVREIDPVRARYIAAGISFISLATLAAFVGVRILDSVSRLETHQHRTMRVLGFAALPAAYVGCTIALVIVLTGMRATMSLITDWDWSYFLRLGVFGMGATLLVVMRRNRKHDWHTWLGGSIILGSLGALILALLAYGTSVYPSIPPWLGGGRPDRVELVLEDPARDCPPCGAGPVELIDDDSSRVVVLVQMPDGQKRAIEIARAGVRSILHSPGSPPPLSGR